LIILTLLTGAFAPRPTRSASEELISKSVRFEKTSKATRQTELLQFTSGGHALGFEPDGVYLATSSHVLRESFVGTKGVAPLADPSTGSVQIPSGVGQAEAVSLDTVTYPDLWPGITLVYDSPPGGILRSTYQVAPGADPNQIALRYNIPVQIDESGNLVFEFETGQMTASAPVAWQEIKGQRVPVDVAFEIDQTSPPPESGETERGLVHFSLASYNPAYSLTIDPTLEWHTFLGSSSDDVAYGIAVDGSGNVYVTGNSEATWGSPKNGHAGGVDAFAAKLNSSGGLVWNTFLGSSSNDHAYGIAVDGSGNVYVAGYSWATWGSPKKGHAGSNDAFAAKLDNNGNRVWNTFLGSASFDSSYSIAVDGGGNVYVAGRSDATWGSPKKGHAGGTDAFAAKLDSDGNRVWNTFMGSASGDGSTAIAVDGDGNIYVFGASGATWGSPVNGHAGGDDAFVTKLNSSGGLVWNIFMGASSNERTGYSIAVDGGGNVYVTGRSEGTWGSPVNGYAGGWDAFAAKLDSDGNRVWNTFMGSGSDDGGYAFAVDEGRNVYVTGYSRATWGSPVNLHAGSDDAFAARLDSSSGYLVWNTFLGSSDYDIGHDIAVGENGGLYLAGASMRPWGNPVSGHTGSVQNDILVAKLGIPEMDVQGNGISIPDGDTTPDAADLTDFGNAALDDTLLHTFVIKNIGTSDLNLSDNPRVTIAGTHAADFSLTIDATTPVVRGQITFFQITFQPSAEGLREATISIANNSLDENPYDFSIQGIGGIGGAGADGDGALQGGLVRVVVPGGTANGQLVIRELSLGSTGAGENFRLGDQLFDIYVNFSPAIEVCIKPSNAELQQVGDNVNLLVLMHKHGNGPWEPLNTYVKDGQICAKTSKLSLFGLGVPPMPATGFPPETGHAITAGLSDREYYDYGDMQLEIPDLDLAMPIVGVPLTAEGWDVSWLEDQAGYLYGTAFPTWEGNTAITAHVWDADNQPGPFVDLHTLGHGDRVEIHAWGQVYTYEVRAVERVRADDLRFLPHEEYDVLTLITCQGYDESSGEYDWRLAVRAVLINVE